MDDELKAVLDGIVGRLDALAQGQERLAQGQEGLTQGQERLTQEQERLAQGQLELRTVMMERFERIENKLTTLHEDVGVNMGAVMHANRSRADERKQNDDLFGLVLKMEQQILRLQTDVEELKKAS